MTEIKSIKGRVAFICPGYIALETTNENGAKHEEYFYFDFSDPDEIYDRSFVPFIRLNKAWIRFIDYCNNNAVCVKDKENVLVKNIYQYLKY